MELTTIAIGGLALFSYLIHGFWEISALKYARLRAMATQSDAVDRALRELLRGKVHDKLCNRDFRRLEKVYLTSLNAYLLRNGGLDDASLRRSILRDKRLTF